MFPEEEGIPYPRNVEQNNFKISRFSEEKKKLLVQKFINENKFALNL